jgi:hypothetical protein
MSFLDSFERKGLFRFTRVLALLIIGVLIIGLIGGAIYFSSTLIPTNSKRVDPAKVIAAIAPPLTPNTQEAPAESTPSDTTSVDTANSFPGLKIPFSLQSYFAVAEFREFMSGKLSGLSLADEQEYVDNMAEVVDAAKAAGLKETDAMDTYTRMKDEKRDAIAAAKAEALQTRLYLLGTAASALGLIGLFSLILVLLSIERNTRVRTVELVNQ